MRELLLEESAWNSVSGVDSQISSAPHVRIDIKGIRAAHMNVLMEWKCEGAGVFINLETLTHGINKLSFHMFISAVMRGWCGGNVQYLH